MSVVPQSDVLGTVAQGMECQVKMGRNKYLGKIWAIGMLKYQCTFINFLVLYDMSIVKLLHSIISFSQVRRKKWSKKSRNFCTLLNMEVMRNCLSINFLYL